MCQREDSGTSPAPFLQRLGCQRGRRGNKQEMLVLEALGPGDHVLQGEEVVTCRNAAGWKNARLLPALRGPATPSMGAERFGDDAHHFLLSLFPHSKQSKRGCKARMTPRCAGRQHPKRFSPPRAFALCWLGAPQHRDGFQEQEPPVSLPHHTEPGPLPPLQSQGCELAAQRRSGSSAPARAQHLAPRGSSSPHPPPPPAPTKALWGQQVPPRGGWWPSLLQARSIGGDVAAWSCGTPGWCVTTATKQGMAVPTEAACGVAAAWLTAWGGEGVKGSPKRACFQMSENEKWSEDCFLCSSAGEARSAAGGGTAAGRGLYF